MLEKIPPSRKRGNFAGCQFLQQLNVGAFLDILHRVAGVKNFLAALLNAVVIEARMRGANNNAGNIDVFAMDRSTLAGYMNETVELLQPEVKFGEQGYGVATKKDCDLSAVVDQVVCDRLADGWLDQEVKTWGLV